MSELVREIVEVNAFLEGDEENPQLIVEVEGLAPTGGWTNVRLDPHVYITPPDDGFQDFDMVGVRPQDASTDALSPIEAAWEGALEDWLIGVRVHAVDNMLEEDVFVIGDDEDEDEDNQASEAA